MKKNSSDYLKAVTPDGDEYEKFYQIYGSNPQKKGAPFGSRNAAKYPDNLKPVTIRLLPNQIAKIKAIATAQETTYNELIRRWIDSLEAPE